MKLPAFRKLLKSSITELIEKINPAVLLTSYIGSDGYLMAGANRLDLASFRNIYVISGGKASLAMIKGIEPIMDKVTEGIVIYPEKATPPELPTMFKAYPSSHPLPSSASLKAGKAMMDIAHKAGESDILICLISGGLSAMAEYPALGVSLEDISHTTDNLLKAGADIYEINRARKKLSSIKGGKLAIQAYPAQVTSFILSDVPKNDLAVIASGLTVPEIGGKEKLPAPSPKISNTIIGSNDNAITALANFFSSKGFKVRIGAPLDGESRTSAKKFVQEFLSYSSTSSFCLISGGETTVTVRGKGKGGRNQEFALAVSLELNGTENIYGYAFGTDGIDGPTDAGGAYFSSERAKKSERALEHLHNNDSYNYFKALNDLIHTGPTGTNVMDVAVIIRDSDIHTGQQQKIFCNNSVSRQ